MTDIAARAALAAADTPEDVPQCDILRANHTPHPAPEKYDLPHFSGANTSDNLRKHPHRPPKTTAEDSANKAGRKPLETQRLRLAYMRALRLSIKVF